MTVTVSVMYQNGFLACLLVYPNWRLDVGILHLNEIRQRISAVYRQRIDYSSILCPFWLLH